MHPNHHSLWPVCKLLGYNCTILGTRCFKTLLCEYMPVCISRSSCLLIEIYFPTETWQTNKETNAGVGFPIILSGIFSYFVTDPPSRLCHSTFHFLLMSDITCIFFPLAFPLTISSHLLPFTLHLPVTRRIISTLGGVRCNLMRVSDMQRNALPTSNPVSF